MNDARCMPYGPIQGQGRVALKVRNSSIFKIYLCHLLILKLDENTYIWLGWTNNPISVCRATVINKDFFMFTASNDQ